MRYWLGGLIIGGAYFRNFTVNEQHTLSAVEKESGRHFISLNQLTLVFVFQTANSEIERFLNDLEKWFW